MLVQRFDVGRLDRAKRTGAGGARVPASISRTGVQVYTDQQGRTVREYRPAETVFATESLDSLGSIFRRFLRATSAGLLFPTAKRKWRSITMGRGRPPIFTFTISEPKTWHD